MRTLKDKQIDLITLLNKIIFITKHTMYIDNLKIEYKNQLKNIAENCDINEFKEILNDDSLIGNLALQTESRKIAFIEEVDKCLKLYKEEMGNHINEPLMIYAICSDATLFADQINNYINSRVKVNIELHRDELKNILIDVYLWYIFKENQPTIEEYNTIGSIFNNILNNYTIDRFKSNDYNKSLHNLLDTTLQDLLAASDISQKIATKYDVNLRDDICIKAYGNNHHLKSLFQIAQGFEEKLKEAMDIQLINTVEINEKNKSYRHKI